MQFVEVTCLIPPPPPPPSFPMQREVIHVVECSQEAMQLNIMLMATSLSFFSLFFLDSIRVNASTYM